jgi:hypothetical protein
VGSQAIPNTLDESQIWIQHRRKVTNDYGHMDIAGTYDADSAADHDRGWRRSNYTETIEGFHDLHSGRGQDQAVPREFWGRLENPERRDGHGRGINSACRFSIALHRL